MHKHRKHKKSRLYFLGHVKNSFISNNLIKYNENSNKNMFKFARQFMNLILKYYCCGVN